MHRSKSFYSSCITYSRNHAFLISHHSFLVFNRCTQVWSHTLLPVDFAKGMRSGKWASDASTDSNVCAQSLFRIIIISYSKAIIFTNSLIKAQAITKRKQEKTFQCCKHFLAFKMLNFISAPKILKEVIETKFQELKTQEKNKCRSFVRTWEYKES